MAEDEGSVTSVNSIESLQTEEPERRYEFNRKALLLGYFNRFRNRFSQFYKRIEDFVNEYSSKLILISLVLILLTLSLALSNSFSSNCYCMNYNKSLEFESNLTAIKDEIEDLSSKIQFQAQKLVNFSSKAERRELEIQNHNQKFVSLESEIRGNLITH